MIGKRLQMVRKNYKIGQAEFANIMGVSKFTVQSWEQDKSDPSDEKIVFICNKYHVSAVFLLGISDELPKYEPDGRIDLYKGLNKENQEKLNSYARFLREQQK